MNNLLSKFPRAIIVVSALAFGIFIIVVADPPRTACDAQAEQIMTELDSLLLPAKVGKSKGSTTRYSRLVNHCKSTNSPGGCYEYFSQIRQLLGTVSSAEPKCYGEVGRQGPLKAAMWQSADLMVRLAWGDKPPTSYYDKMGWMQYSEINLFCLLKNKLIDFYGQQAWGDFRENMMSGLPGSDQLPREKAWNMMIVSLDCKKFQ